jgi:hypothetical protein
MFSNAGCSKINETKILNLKICSNKVFQVGFHSSVYIRFYYGSDSTNSFLNRINAEVIVRFIPKENLIRLNEEELRRAGRQDQRFDEEITRDDNAIRIEARVNAIIEKLGELAANASNVVTSNFDCNINLSFNSLRNILNN